MTLDELRLRVELALYPLGWPATAAAYMIVAVIILVMSL
jgi:hypothetical protein